MHIEWPNHEQDRIYSPSSIIKTFFKPQEKLTVKQFNKTCKQSLDEASKRVQQKYGYACTSAIAEAERIDELCEEYNQASIVKIVSF